MLTMKEGSGEGLGGCCGLTFSLPPSSPCPEKIFSEVTPKCEKCQSVVKPGEPRGLGPPEVDLGWDSLAHEALPTPPASPQGRPHPCPGSAFCSCLCSGSLPVSVPPTPLPSTPHSSAISFCLCVSLSICLHLRYRVLR